MVDSISRYNVSSTGNLPVLQYGIQCRDPVITVVKHLIACCGSGADGIRIRIHTLKIGTADHRVNVAGCYAGVDDGIGSYRWTVRGARLTLKSCWFLTFSKMGNSVASKRDWECMLLNARSIGLGR